MLQRNDLQDGMRCQEHIHNCPLVLRRREAGLLGENFETGLGCIHKPTPNLQNPELRSLNGR